MPKDVKLFNRALGQEIARVRKEKGFTQLRLSALLNKDGQTISRIERGGVNPSCHIVWQIANVLEVDISEFFVNLG